jgi:uncharacterized protein DUF3619
MNTTDDELARRIIQHLDFGADHIEPRTRERLLEARKAALSHYKEELQPARGLAWAGGALTRRESSFFSPRNVIAGAALIAVLIGMAYWQNNGSNPANELADIDVGLLTEDLPINAYLDKGFDSWLKRSSR